MTLAIRRALKAECKYDFLRNFSVKQKAEDPHLQQAKQILKERGWTYRDAAPALNVHFVHLCRVLCGHRTSAALLRRIAEIQPRDKAA